MADDSFEINLKNKRNSSFTPNIQIKKKEEALIKKSDRRMLRPTINMKSSTKKIKIE